MVSQWILSDSIPAQFSRTILSILADLNDVVVLMVSTCCLISKSSSPCINTLVTVQIASIKIGINITFMFHNFFNSWARSRFLSFFSLSFNFILWSANPAKSTIWQVLSLSLSLFFFFFFTITRSGRLSEIRRSVCILKSQRSLGFSFSRTDFGLCI